MAKITSVQILNDKTPEILEAMKSQVLLGLQAIGMEAEGYAKDDCPVDTGRLRNSISNKVVDSEMAVYIGSNVVYAPAQEFGEFKHKVGKPHFLRDAAANHDEHYKAIMEKFLKS